MKPITFRFQPFEDGSPGGIVHFTCGDCGEEGHVLAVPAPTSRHFWKLDQVEPLSISPSVRWFKHAHFNIVNGAAQMHGDEPCKGRTN